MVRFTELAAVKSAMHPRNIERGNDGFSHLIGSNSELAMFSARGMGGGRPSRVEQSKVVRWSCILL